MKFAQISNGKVHWIFEANEKPQFASNIVLVDITDMPEVQEGWGYDDAMGKFSEPILPKPDPKEPTETEILTDYIVDVDYRVTMIELGLQI